MARMVDRGEADWAAGRDESRIVRDYLEALEWEGHECTSGPTQNLVGEVEVALGDADPMRRPHLDRDRTDLPNEGETLDETVRGAALEEEFVAVASSYSDHRGISYATSREVGVDAAVLRRAGVTPSPRRRVVRGSTTANWAVIRSPTELPTIRLANGSLMGQQ